MRHNLLSLNDKNEDIITFCNFSSNGSNSLQIENLKKVLFLALKFELTDRQRECITMYFLENRKIPQIADELSLSCSTVSRHITAGKKKLMKLAKYY